MAYVIKTVATKPAGIPWFVQSSPAAAISVANISTWTRNSPGYLTSLSRSLTVDVHEGIVVFDTQANAEAWVASRATQPDFVAHDAYFAEKGITQTDTIYP